MLYFLPILSMCLMLHYIPKCDCVFYKDAFSNPAKPSVNVFNSHVNLRKSEQSQKVNTIMIDAIRHKLWDNNTYVRQLQFHSFGISFKLFLRRNTLFHKDIILNVGNQPIEKHNVNKYLPVLFVGVMDNVSNSAVYGKVLNEEFEIVIKFGKKTFSAECQYKEPDGTKSSYLISKNSLHNCRAYRWQIPKLSNLGDKVDSCESQSGKYKDFLSKLMPMNVHTMKEDGKMRTKRSMSPSAVTGNCVLHLVADHLYYENVGKGDISKTITEMVIGLAVADLIFRQTDFDGNGGGDNIGFKIGNITIYRNFQNYHMKDEGLDAYTYLDKFSEYDFSEYCLGVVYTYRDFEDGIVGLAWVGNSNIFGPAGGICQRRLWYRPDRKYYSYNTALITQLSHGQFVSSYISGLVLAHEFGHSFGSSHDNKTDPVCSPGGNFGNYIMYPYTSDGNLANHRRFSSCSISSIYPVLVNKSPGCFEEDLGPVCGNGIVENGEECDCGSADICSEIDPCCTPEKNSSEITDTPCNIRRSQGYQCSPKTAICCTETCKYHNTTNMPHCSEMSECASVATCEPDQGTCPDPVPQPDGTPCDSGRKMCTDGRCSLSICVWLGLKDCQCSKTLQDACYVCCIPTNASSCGCCPVSKYATDKTDMHKHKGDPCYNYKGFCDEAGQCILEETNTLDGLNKLLSEETVVNLGVWLKKYWYYIIVGTIVATGLAIVVSLLFKPKPDDHIDAMRMGKLSAILTQAETQKTTYRDKMENCEAAFQKIIQQIQSQQCPKALTQAVARLSIFFPTAPISLLVKSVQSSSSEEFAVKMLLLRDFPMQRFSISLPTVDGKSLMQVSSDKVLL